MKFQRLDVGDATTLTITGSLDAISTPELRASIEALVAERRTAVRVDAAGLRLIDSSGVGALVSLYKRIKAQGGKVTVTGLRDQPLAIFKLLRMDKVFNL